MLFNNCTTRVSTSENGFLRSHAGNQLHQPSAPSAGYSFPAGGRRGGERAEGAVRAPVPIWHVRFLLPKFAEKTLKCSVRADILCMTKKEARSKPTTTGRCDSHHCWLRCARNIVHCSDLNTRECQTSATARLTKKLRQAAPQRRLGVLGMLSTRGMVGTCVAGVASHTCTRGRHGRRQRRSRACRPVRG